MAFRHTFVFADGMSSTTNGVTATPYPLITANGNYPDANGILWQGGVGQIALSGTLGGGTYTLQQRLPDRSTWVTISTISAVGLMNFFAPADTRLRLVVAGATGASASAWALDFPEGTAFPQVSVNLPSDTNGQFVKAAPLTKTDRSIVASTSNQIAAPANATRTRIMVENQDATNTVYVNFGAAATTTTVAGNGSKRIGPQGFFEFTGTNQALNIIAAAGTPAVTIWEF